MSLPVLSAADLWKKLSQKSYSAQDGYLAMYSTWWNGIVKEPFAMLVPIDDHLVHRGDGVFEAIKAVSGQVYLLDQHLDRLCHSAEKISLTLPKTKEEIRHIVLETAAAAGVKDILIRLFISRGPGGFTTNPYDSIGSQMYLVITSLKSPPPAKFQAGVRIGKSLIPPKESWWAQVKTCNYLPNVMMKKESVDRDLDFTVAFDSHGFLTESSTENIILVDQDNKLVRPHLGQILKGTTMMRAFELAGSLLAQKILAGIEERNLNENDLIQAKEVMMVGTTLDVLSVSHYEGKPIGSGQQGPISSKLLMKLREDMKMGPHVTPLV